MVTPKICDVIGPVQVVPKPAYLTFRRMVRPKADGIALFRIAFALVAALLALPAMAADTLPPPSGKAIPVPQATIMSRSYPNVGSCAPYQDAYLAAGWPRGVDIDTVKQIDSLVRKRMVLRNDVGADVWTPLTKALIEGKRVVGDCDDMSITNAQLAVCAGMPADRLGLLITASPNAGNGELHMLAFYKDPKDQTWVFGDTFGRPRALSRVSQRLIFMAYLNDVTRWYGLLGRDAPSLGTSEIPATSAIPLLPEAEQSFASCTLDGEQRGH